VFYHHTDNGYVCVIGSEGFMVMIERYQFKTGAAIVVFTTF